MMGVEDLTDKLIDEIVKYYKEWIENDDPSHYIDYIRKKLYDAEG